MMKNPRKNVERLDKLASALSDMADYEGKPELIESDQVPPEKFSLTVDEAGEARFDMSLWAMRGDCGTVCCVAGLAVGLFAEPDPEHGKHDGVAWSYLSLGRELLGLTTSESYSLFLPCMPRETLTAAQASEACRRLRDLDESKRDNVQEEDLWS